MIIVNHYSKRFLKGRKDVTRVGNTTNCDKGNKEGGESITVEVEKKEETKTRPGR